MKLIKASTGQGELPFRGTLGAPLAWPLFSFSASAKAFLKAADEGSRFDRRSQ